MKTKVKRRELEYADPLKRKGGTDEAAEFADRLGVVDEGDLHNEGDFQIGLTGHYAEMLAAAEKAHSEAELALTVTRAKVELEVRSSAEGKVTEGQIKANVTCNARVMQAEQDVIDAKYKVGMMKAAMQKVDSRKRAIENRIKLLELNYWSAPRRRA